mmetsp:Transcript_5160/g.7900  ORF Transcript_5160/g.7900 Transcript_5160/m.7900 type:complete len:898 (+) Transcript_5160:232-2925(+)|eukprot:CAMPEP_0185037952 /NCGR_PEP_ID=MMETSP1103-20130426/33015_1 /TAXON_ID=36769 /ORGANISM="Paraphysomonas bandaiensis, Strain Caron Lab Isolate" /LENGTH=897 /DNA_ID=CAMNT_0027576177 /DNA_START=170 /DNA_END=2863 /DNA_ORIENTATION=+
MDSNDGNIKPERGNFSDITPNVSKFLFSVVKNGGQAASDLLKSPGVHSLFGLYDNNNGDDSSDDESCLEDEGFIAYGTRGIIVFNCTMLKQPMNEEIVIHLELYTGVVRMYMGRKKKRMKCTDLVNLIRGSECTVQMMSRRALSLGVKAYRFAGRELAYQFQQYVEYMQDCGPVVRAAFDAIDRKNTGVITSTTLSQALSSQDISYTSQTVDTMLAMSAQKRFDFSDFFHVLLGTHVYSLYSCLVSWMHKSEQLITEPQELESPLRMPSDISDVTLPEAPSEYRKESENNSDGVPVQPNILPLSSPAERDVSEGDLPLLPGESVANTIPRVKWYLGASAMASSGIRNNPDVPPHFPFSVGTMTLTNYRIALICTQRRHDSSKYHLPPFFNLITIPLNTVHKMALITSSTSPQKCSIRIHTKDLRVMRIHFLKPGHGLQYVEMLLHTIQQMCFSGVRAHLFAYRYLGSFDNDGWALSDVRIDYMRMGLHANSDWQVYDNSDWKLVDTYPPYIVLPRALSDKNIALASAYRSRNRLPAVTYIDPISQSVLIRSAQPLVGITLQTSAADQLLLNYCRLSGSLNKSRSHEIEPTFHILDARGHMAATVNMAAGKGTEDVTCYVSTELEFCNIENIHVMRTSYAAVGELLTPSACGLHGTPESDGNFYVRLDESGWTKHCKLLLAAAVKAAERIRLEGSSVLIHCSDGWDRTAQICSLTETLLDPYYRTLTGFCVLVEKEWCSFGYKFQDRCGHAEPHTNLPDERSPVFVQWLDAMYQLLVQFGSAFEYNESLLVFVADHVHSGLFGNFLGNSERQRVEQLNVRKSTQSIWSYVEHNRERFVNTNYRPYNNPLWPKYSQRCIRLWERFFCRWDPAVHPHSINGVEWHDDWGNGLDTMECESV